MARTTDTEKRKVTDLGNGFIRVDVKVKDSNRPEGQQQIDHSYVIPSYENFRKWFDTLPQTVKVKTKNLETGQIEEKEITTTQKDVYDDWAYAVDSSERASVRLAVAQESTIIRRDGVEYDLLKLDTDPAKAIRRACAAINSALGSAIGIGDEKFVTVQNAVKVARRKLLEQGVIVEAKVSLGEESFMGVTPVKVGNSVKK